MRIVRSVGAHALDVIEAAQKRTPRREPFNLRGAAYRIRTYDALIRSQVLYPAEVTPRVVIYNAVPSLVCQRGFQDVKKV